MQKNMVEHSQENGVQNNQEDRELHSDTRWIETHIFLRRGKAQDPSGGNPTAKGGEASYAKYLTQVLIPNTTG